jgi:drug/metabolite transporter (DMT)-like permease
MFASEALALGAATCIALSTMFINELNGRVPLMQLVRWQLTAGCLITAAAATFMDGWKTLGVWQLQSLAASGMVGIAFASTTYFAAIYRAGPRVTALLFTLTSPFALALGYAALGETINRLQVLGVIAVLCGLRLAIGLRRRRSSPHITGSETEPLESPAPGDPRPSAFGIALGTLTALGQALGALLARPAMASGVEPFAAMAVRSGLAAVCFWALLAVPAVRRRSGPIRRPDLALAIAAAFFGTALGMALMMAALQGGNVGIVSTLSSMTPVLILPMVWCRTGRPPPPLAWGGAALAITGTALIGLA